jgi:outer membrane protein OmpA-like peptidoglycan-associated protein
MSRGDLQEMEQSKTAVNANAKPAEPMHKLSNPGEGQSVSYDDLGGPTPENYRAMAKMSKMEETETEEEVLEEEEIVSESEEVTEETVDIEEDVNALLGGEELSEEFKEKARVIFEAALTSKIKEIQETLEVQYAERLEEERQSLKGEERQSLKGELTERVDSYLEYVCQEWMSENELAIEHGLKTEMTESFLSGMKGLFEEHYVVIPEDKYDVLESMVEKLDDMETKLNEQIDKNINLNKRLAESTADVVLSVVSEGLAETQKEKLASLAESVEFESEEEYREKLETLKESYFSKAPTAKSEAPQTLSESVDSTPAPVASSMEVYLRTLGAFKK